MRSFGLIDRFVIRDVLTPSLLGFVVYTFLLMMRGLFGLIEQVAVQGVPLRDAGRILLATLPHVAVLTIPMAFLFGTLLAVGRMNTENEILAMQASGISLRRVLRPVLITGVALAILNGYLYLVVIPSANRSLRSLKVEVFSKATNLGNLEARVFYEELPNLLVYVEEVDPRTGVWQDVLVYDSSEPGVERLTLAGRGRLAFDTDPVRRSGMTVDATPEPWIVLEGVVTHQFFRYKPGTYHVNVTQTQRIRPQTGDRGTVRYTLGMSERDSVQLARFVFGDGELKRADDGELDESDREMQRRLAGIEIHQRIAIPAACIVFALIGLPLGVGSRSGGRGRGFLLSIGVVLLYYVLNNHGELLAVEGRIPVWLGMWAPNLLLTTAAVLMMRRMGRWLGERQAPGNPILRGVRKLAEWVRRRRSQRRRARGAVNGEPLTGSIPIRLQRARYGGGFPSLLDRYLTHRLLAPLFLVLISTASLYVVVDLTDHVDEMAENHAPLEVILGYYANLLPQVLMDVIPFALMIGALILLTVLERQHELTACKGAGISVYRMMVPILLVAGAGTAVMFVLGDSVVPEANRDAKRLLDRIKGRETARSYDTTDQQWLLSRDKESFYNFLRYDIEEKILYGFNQFRVDESMTLRFHLFAERARWVDGSWVADAGWFRRFYEDGSDEYRRFTAPMKLSISEPPNHFGQEYRRPTEMSARELGEHIKALEATGYQPGRLLVHWHQKFSYPLSAFVMVLLALPFALNRGERRVSTMQGVALALGLGIGYFLVVAVFGKLGEARVLPPLIGAWAPVVLTSLFAVNRLTTIRT